MIEVRIDDQSVVFTPVINERFFELRDIYNKSDKGEVDLVHGVQAGMEIMQTSNCGYRGMITNCCPDGHTLLLIDDVGYIRPGTYGQVLNDLFARKEVVWNRISP